MTVITIYDTTADAIEKIAAAEDTTTAEIVDALLSALDENGVNIADYL